MGKPSIIEKILQRGRHMELEFKLQVFEGPLDLLLHLLDKNKVSIYDIPIVEITNQYMEYIRQMQKHDLNVVSEFMVMAATLLDIKSKMLLPADPSEEEDEEDPRAELVQQLLEYKLYKCMAFELKDRQVDASHIFYKEPTVPEEVLAYTPPIDTKELVSDLTLNQLNDIFKSVLKRQKDKIDPSVPNSERSARKKYHWRTRWAICQSTPASIKTLVFVSYWKNRAVRWK